MLNDKKSVIFEIIVCPDCKAGLKESEKGFACTKCKKVYSSIAGTPVFFNDYVNEKLKKMIGKTKAGKEMGEKFFDKSILGLIKKNLLKVFYPTEDRMVNKTNSYRTQVKGFPILNVGSGMKNEDESDINLDIDRFPYVDIVGDAHALPIKTNSIGMIISRYVLEHVSKPELVVREVHRVLKKDGIVYVEVPFIQRFHGYPYDYQRFTTMGLLELMKDFKKLEIGVAGGPGIAVIEIILNYLWFVSKGKLYLFIFLIIPFIIPMLIIRFYDNHLRNRSNAHELAISLYYIGKKV